MRRFPFGLFMMQNSGGELYTGNTVMTGAAWLEGQLPLQEMLKNWALSLAGNAAGSLGMVALFAASGVFSGPASAGIVGATVTKASLTLSQVCLPSVGFGFFKLSQRSYHREALPGVLALCGVALCGFFKLSQMRPSESPARPL